MPIYEYRCDDCGELTETLRSMANADAALECEHCGSAKTRRVQSVFAASTGGSATPDACPMGQPGMGGGGCCCGGGACPH